jgi:YggT family protein
MILDVVGQIEQFVDVFVYVYVILLILVILSSWFPRMPYGLNPVLRFLHDVCDPYLNLFRRFIPPIGMLDISPMVAIVVLIVLLNVLNALLDRLH